MLDRSIRRAALAALLLALPPLASAVDIGEGKLSLNGNGGWAYARTDGNFYFADGDGDYELSRFDLALSARPADRLVVSAAFGFTPRESRLEWVFAEWRLSDALRLRVGQVKQPLGNYQEIQFVGTARPFFELPTSVYGPADIGATSYYGAGLTGERAFGDWGLQYDLYGGAIDVPEYEPYEALEPGWVPGEPIEQGTMLIENIVGGRLSLAAPNGLVLRASAYGGKVQQEGDEEEGSPGLFVGGLSAFYRGEKLWVSAEGFTVIEADAERQLAAYAELGWFLTGELQVAARYEWSRVELEEFEGDSPLLRHDEVSAGLNWWFTPDLVAKASYSFVDGQRFVAPGEDELEADGRTQLVFVGAQFTF